MARNWVNFRAVKANISMEMAVAQYGIMLCRVNRCHMRGRCPLPTHASKNGAQSFIVNTEKNAWACHSNSCVAARGGQLGGNVLDFVASMENCSIRAAALRLQDWFGMNSSPGSPGAAVHAAAEPPADPPRNAESNRPLLFTLTRIDSRHPYLRERGVSPETALHFGIGLFPGKGSMAGRIVIPIHNEDGILVAYAGRGLRQTEPKYRFPTRFRKSLVLFNLCRAVHHGKRVVIVEGFFDCFKVHQAGVPCVVALMGCSLSRRQTDLLEQHFDEAVLLLDGDKAGRAASANIAAQLVPKLPTRLVQVPQGSQPDQLSEDQIRCLCIPGYF
jgi:DNA primase